MSRITQDVGFTPAKKRVLVSVTALALAMLTLVLVMVQAPSRPAYAQTDSLPDLGMLHPKALSIENTSGGQKLLRFTSIVVNVGAGPFEVHGQRSAGASTMTTTQRIFNDAPPPDNYRDVPTDAIIFWGGDGHNHWHVQDLLDFELIRLDNGSKVGNFAKQGFCFYDNYLYGSSNPAFYRPRTGACGGGLTATQTMMGLSPGWGDRYAAHLVGQYIDITGLTPGRYRLMGTADANDWFLESDNANNVTWVDIQLRSERARIVEYGPSAPQPAAAQQPAATVSQATTAQ
jgi:lysyl oxidase